MEESDVPNLPYLQSIVKETLHLHPSILLIAWLSSKAYEINRYDVPANTMLLVKVWAIGRDPKLWEKPLRFRPERFLKSGVDVRGNTSR